MKNITKLIHPANVQNIRTTEATVLMFIFVILLPIWSKGRQPTNACLTGYASVSAVCADSSKYSLEEIVNAIAVAEGASDTDRAGDSGRAAGRYQLHEGAVLHVNQRFKTTYVWPRDALKPTTAQEIVKLYLIVLGYTYPENMCTKQYFLNIEKCVRKYNGGYKYCHSRKAWKYWQRVKTALEK